MLQQSEYLPGNSSVSSNAVTKWQHCIHSAITPTLIGGFSVHLGREMNITPATIGTIDFLCPLNGNLPSMYFGQWTMVCGSELKDRGGVPEFWKKYINILADEIKAGKKALAYCTGGHGRTGTFGASLIAVMEPETEDPIAAIRERYCKQAVESKEQAEAIFELRGEELPEKYKEEFKSTFFQSYIYSGGKSGYKPYSWWKLETAWKSTDKKLNDLLEEAWRDGRINGWIDHKDYNVVPDTVTKLRLYAGYVISDDLIVPISEVPGVLEALRQKTWSIEEHRSVPANLPALKLKYCLFKPYSGSAPTTGGNGGATQKEGEEEFYGF